MNCNGAYPAIPQPSASNNFRCQIDVGVHSYMFIENALLLWSCDIKKYKFLDVKYSIVCFTTKAAAEKQFC